MSKNRNLLFVCSRNRWRSPTAEAIWRKYPGVNARSAGMSASARHRVSANDVAWADLIFAMEDKHRRWLVQEFRNLVHGKTVHVLDLPDEYGYMDAELMELRTQAVSHILGLQGS